ncbi:GTP-binding protein EngA [Corallincola luteus]|uniref:GTP-binding protein EngA n=1 Tax=Corallincola luteus TaxID=1775177 RepID=A0ABY2AJ83_9GAMM|nr:zf-TFIIB domain-containing protein [Corallincola luteus]TCI01075.1 GTP-binding protein EngA [Corallincola luteus]
MLCPRTKTPLKKLKVGGIEVDVSEACGGVFFDNQELSKFENGKEIRGEALAKHLKQFNTTLLNEHERVNCPKCEDVVMMRRYFSPLNVLEIDECPGCGGIWLDTGELEKMHDLAISKKERALLRGQLMDQYREAPKPQVTKVRKRQPFVTAHSAPSRYDWIMDLAESLLGRW